MSLSETVRAELDDLRDGVHDGDTDLGPLRERIDAIDETLLALLNERLAYAHEIGVRKHKMDTPVYAPGREADIIENVRRANHGPLPDDVVQRLFERIIEETRLLELQHFEATPDDDASSADS